MDLSSKCIATYLPEANVLAPIGTVAEHSNTPIYETVLVKLRRSEATEQVGKLALVLTLTVTKQMRYSASDCLLPVLSRFPNLKIDSNGFTIIFLLDNYFRSNRLINTLIIFIVKI